MIIYFKKLNNRFNSILFVNNDHYENVIFQSIICLKQNTSPIL